MTNGIIHTGTFFGGPHDGDKLTLAADVIVRGIEKRQDTARYEWEEGTAHWAYKGAGG